MLHTPAPDQEHEHKENGKTKGSEAHIGCSRYMYILYMHRGDFHREVRSEWDEMKGKPEKAERCFVSWGWMLMMLMLLIKQELSWALGFQLPSLREINKILWKYTYPGFSEDGMMVVPSQYLNESWKSLLFSSLPVAKVKEKITFSP